MSVGRFLVKAAILGFLPNLAICVLLDCSWLPRAYGICIVCHARDMVNWFLKALGFSYFTFGLFLTPVGILLGSFLASRGQSSSTAGESGERGLLDSMLTGFSVALGALLAGACQARAVMLLAWMDPGALAVLAGVVVGVLLWRE